MEILKKIAFCAFFLVVFLVSAAPPAYSELNIERATRETDRLGREEKERMERALIKQPEKPAEVSPSEIITPPAEEKKFFIKKINLAGCESFSPEDFADILKKYENREITLTELNAMAKEVERDYLRRGVIAAVFVPPQEIKEETVIIQVVEARMGRVEIQDHKYFSKERLSYYWGIRPQEILRYDDIAKSLQLMNKNPDRQVKAALHAGEKTGTTDVVLTPKTNFPLHATYTFDNEGESTTGKTRQGYGLRHNNFLGLDDTFIIGYSFGQAFYGRYFYHSLPLNSEGASLLYGYSYSGSEPQKDYAASCIKATAYNITASFHQDLYKGSQYLGEAYAGLDVGKKLIHNKLALTNQDRLRVLRAGGNFVSQGPSSSAAASVEYSQGLPIWEATRRRSYLASRGARSVFSSLNLGAQHRRNLSLLNLNLQANLKFKGQVTSRKLTPQEEFSLGGIDSVRGYPASDYLADNAATQSVELLVPAVFLPDNLRLPYARAPLKNQITTLAFMDYGWGMRKGALPSEKRYVSMFGMGAGVRLKVFDQALLRLEWGFPMAANHPLTEAGDSHFHFSVDFQDKLPEEIERIRQMMQEQDIKLWALELVDKELRRTESPLRKKLYTYLYLARAYEKKGRLEEAKKFYEKVEQLSKSLYQQAEDYVRGCLEQEKELRECQRLALAYSKEGKFTQARQEWQKIVDSAKLRPLILEY